MHEEHGRGDETDKVSLPRRPPSEQPLLGHHSLADRSLLLWVTDIIHCITAPVYCFGATKEIFSKKRLRNLRNKVFLD